MLITQKNALLSIVIILFVFCERIDYREVLKHHFRYYTKQDIEAYLDSTYNEITRKETDVLNSYSGLGRGNFYKDYECGEDTFLLIDNIYVDTTKLSYPFYYYTTGNCDGITIYYNSKDEKPFAMCISPVDRNVDISFEESGGLLYKYNKDRHEKMKIEGYETIHYYINKKLACDRLLENKKIKYLKKTCKPFREGQIPIKNQWNWTYEYDYSKERQYLGRIVFKRKTPDNPCVE